MAWWQTTITEVLNKWNDMGVFSYVLPFLLIFAVVFAILTKTKLFGDENKPAVAIISLAVGLLALQFDIVATFFATIFPRFGVGIAIMLVLLIGLALWTSQDSSKNFLTEHSWIGYIVGIGVVVWALSDWGNWGGDNFLSGFLNENFAALVVLTLIIVAIWLIAKGSGKSGK
jgi:hypothetical protein